MGSLKRSIKFLNLNLIKSIGVFWIVILIINVASFIVNYKFNTGISFGIHDTNISGMPVMSIVGANILPIFIYIIVYCYEMYYQHFPIAIGFSITRKDFYKSAVVNNILVAFTLSLIQGVLMKLEANIISVVVESPMVDYGIFNTTSDSIIFIIISLFIALLAIISILNILAALNYKYGFKLWIGIGVIFSLSTVFIGTSVTGLFESILTTRLNYLHLSLIIGTMIITYLTGLVIIINTNIKNRIV